MEVEPSFGTQKKCPFPLNRCFVYKDYKIVNVCLDQILCLLNVDFPYRMGLFCQYLIIGLD